MDDQTNPNQTNGMPDDLSEATPAPIDSTFDDQAIAPGDIEAPTEALNPSHSESYVTVAPDEPLISVTPTIAAPIDVVAPKNNKFGKKGIAAIVAAGAIVVLGGGSTLAYTMWYQNPDKVIGDSLVNLMKLKSSTVDSDIRISNKDATLIVKLGAKANQTSGAMNADVKFDSKTEAMGNLKVNIKVDGVYSDKGDAYIKVANLKEAFEGVVDGVVDGRAAAYKDFGYEVSKDAIVSAKAEARNRFDGVVRSVDGQWIKIAAKDLNSSDRDVQKQQQCLKDNFKKLQSNQAMSKEIGTIYKDNRFVTVKEQLGGKDGSLGYLLDFDKKAAKSFGQAVEKTDIYKDINKCLDGKLTKSATSDLGVVDESNFKSVRVELWVDRFSHEMTRIVVLTEPKSADDAAVSVDARMKFNQQITVDTPKDAKTFKQIEAEVKELSSSLGLSI